MRTTATALAFVGFWSLACGGGKKGEDSGGFVTVPTPYNTTTCDTPTVWYPDNDGDGLGHPDHPWPSCSQPAGHVDNGDDCWDSDPAIGLPETWWADRDGDGRTVEEFGCPEIKVMGDNNYDDDCNDNDPFINVFAEELLDGVDNDCNLWLDDLDPFWFHEGYVLVDPEDGPWMVAGDFLGLGGPQLLLGSQLPGDLDLHLFDPAPRKNRLLNQATLLTAAASVQVRPWAAVDLDGGGVDDLLFTTDTSLGVAAGPLGASLDAPTFEWTAADIYASWDAAVIGDFDGDGTPWLAWGVGDRLYLLDGSTPGSWDYTGLASDVAPAGYQSSPGYDVDGGGDTDGDGRPELLIGDRFGGPSREGVVYLLVDRPVPGTAVDVAAASALLGGSPKSFAGRAVSFAGDVNGDGYDDVLASSQDPNALGMQLHYGPLPPAGDFTAGDASLGWNLDGALPLGDLDDDGIEDLAVQQSGRGWWMLHGPVQGAITAEDRPIWWDIGTQGGGLAVVPDTDGDGSDELAIHQWNTLTGAANDPAVYLIDAFAWP